MRRFLQPLIAGLPAVLAAIVFAGLIAFVRPGFALDARTVEQLGFGESDDKVAAVAALVAAGDARALAVLEALAEGDLYTSGRQVLIIKGDAAHDAASDAAVTPVPEERDEVTVNNRLRREVAAAIAALSLASPDREARLAAAKALAGGAEPAMLPLIKKAAGKEADPLIKPMLEIIQATLELQEGSKETRLAAIRTLGASNNPNTKQLLLALLENKDGSAQDDDILIEAQRSLRAVEGRLAWGERIGQVFSGASLGSILLLAALGLAITYGLMGVINMAHGELIMIGAYATYVMQNLFRTYAPDWFNAYLIVAVPVAFAASAVVGMLLERSVIRFLYGRPLETLLATWGISLLLMQLVRNVFGAQNVQVENPAWMSGGVALLSNVVLPYNRIVIIGFALLVLLSVWLALTRTRLGLFVRGVTQNRAMASCMGVHTARVDTWCFGLGSGIAGLAGCALSQIGNVGPDLGQSYIVDSFMVVVLGGVGQLAGTVYAALGLGVVNKFLEAWSGAVLAKIMVLVFIIVFIQKRPQGLFALKGRFADG